MRGSMRRGLGYLPDTPLQAVRYASPRLGAVDPAPSVDWSRYRLPILDQGSTQSCLGHGTAQLLAVASRAAGITLPPVSPRALYRDARALARRDESAPLRDEGGYPSALIDALEYCGAAPFAGDVSDVTTLNVNDEATLTELAEQRERLIVGTEAVPLTDYTTVAATMARALTAGYAVGLGVFAGPEWTEWDGRGVIDTYSTAAHGGHWIACDGYLYDRGTLILRGPNSWGRSWGDYGEWRASLRSMFDAGRLAQAILFGPPRLLRA